MIYYAIVLLTLNVVSIGSGRSEVNDDLIPLFRIANILIYLPIFGRIFGWW